MLSLVFRGVDNHLRILPDGTVNLYQVLYTDPPGVSYSASFVSVLNVTSKPGTKETSYFTSKYQFLQFHYKKEFYSSY